MRPGLVVHVVQDPMMGKGGNAFVEHLRIMGDSTVHPKQMVFRNGDIIDIFFSFNRFDKVNFIIIGYFNILD